MEEEVISNGKKETWSVIVVVALVLLGGVFYGIDIYEKARADDVMAPPTETPSEGPITPAD